MSHIITVTANTNQFGLISGKQYKATEADAKCYSVQIGTVGFESIIAKRFFGVSVYNSTLNIDNITATTPVTFNQYYTLLANHDWFYTFSDSSNVYSLGERREGTLNMLAKRHEFAAYLMAHFSLIRHDAIVAPTGILQQSMTLVELKAKWDAMPRVALHLNWASK